MHSLSSLSAVNSTINLCTGPFFPKAISLSIMQCLFSSAIALQAFQSLKQNEDKSRDLGKTGKKAYYTRFRKAGSTRDQAVYYPKRRDVRGRKESPTQDVRAQTEAYTTTETQGSLVLHMVTRRF